MERNSGVECFAGRRMFAGARVKAALLLAAAIAAAVRGDDAAAAAAAPQAPARPMAAMTAAHADSGLLLGIADTGERLVAVGGNGDIVLSEDGVHWSQVPGPVDVTLTAVAFSDPQHGWAVGHDASILHTGDGGRSWTVQNFQPDLNAPLFAIAALDQKRAVAVGAFGTLKITEDGGAQWSDVAADEVVKDKYHLNAITRIANGDLVLVGEHGTAAVSSDGRGWRKLSAPYEGSFFGVMPWGPRGAIAFGLRGNIYAIADVAQDQWQKIDAQTTNSFFGGLALQGGELALVGGNGEVVAINASGSPRRLSNTASRIGQATTYAAGIDYKGALLVVGEAGVQRVPLN